MNIRINRRMAKHINASKFHCGKKTSFIESESQLGRPFHVSFVPKRQNENVKKRRKETDIEKERERERERERGGMELVVSTNKHLIRFKDYLISFQE